MPPIGSMVPVLVIGLPMYAEALDRARFVIAPPTRLAVMPFSSIKPLLLNGWLIFMVPLLSTKPPPVLAESGRDGSSPRDRAADAIGQQADGAVDQPAIERE